MAVVLPLGTTATLTPATGTAITLNAISITGATRSVAMADITALSDYTLKRLPSRVDPGTVSFELYLDDTATASNHLKTIKDWQATISAGPVIGYNSVTLALNFPGTNIDGLISYQGYISEVTDPTVGAGDDALRFTVTMQVTAV
jgi:hypothetical protein